MSGCARPMVPSAARVSPQLSRKCVIGTCQVHPAARDVSSTRYAKCTTFFAFAIAAAKPRSTGASKTGFAPITTSVSTVPALSAVTTF